MNKWGKKFWQDTAERVGGTFVAALIPLYTVSANVAQLDWVNAVEISASAAGLTLLKCLGSNLGGDGVPTASIARVSSEKVGDVVAAETPVEDPGVEDHED